MRAKSIAEGRMAKVLEHPGSPYLTFDNLRTITRQTSERFDRPIDNLENVADFLIYKRRQRAQEIGTYALNLRSPL
jgi:hypothetical protein